MQADLERWDIACDGGRRTGEDRVIIDIGVVIPWVEGSILIQPCLHISETLLAREFNTGQRILACR